MATGGVFSVVLAKLAPSSSSSNQPAQPCCWFCPVVAVIAGTGGKEGCVAELMPGMGFPLAEWPGTE